MGGIRGKVEFLRVPREVPQLELERVRQRPQNPELKVGHLVLKRY